MDGGRSGGVAPEWAANRTVFWAGGQCRVQCRALGWLKSGPQIGLTVRSEDGRNRTGSLYCYTLVCGVLVHKACGLGFETAKIGLGFSVRLFAFGGLRSRALGCKIEYDGDGKKKVKVHDNYLGESAYR